MVQEHERQMLEKAVALLNNEQRVAVDEFIGVVMGDGDSGSYSTTIEWLHRSVSDEYIDALILSCRERRDAASV